MDIPEKRNKVEDKFDLATTIAEVKSRIKNDITSDFTYARLKEKDKTYILEMFQIASLCDDYLKTTNKESEKKWIWDKNKWIKKKIPEKEIMELDEQRKKIFDLFMKQIYMIAILNRNVKNNYLIQYTMGIPEEEQEQESMPQATKLRKLRGVLQNENKEEQE